MYIYIYIYITTAGAQKCKVDIFLNFKNGFCVLRTNCVLSGDAIAGLGVRFGDLWVLLGRPRGRHLDSLGDGPESLYGQLV